MSFSLLVQKRYKLGTKMRWFWSKMN